MISHEEVFRGLWCTDSESGERVLVNLDTNRVILKSVDGKIMYPTDIPQTNRKTEEST